MLKIKSFTFNPFGENTYLVYNEAGDCLIFDPGCYYPEEENLLAHFIEENGLNLVQLINTHCHLDHIFGNKFIFKKYGLQAYVHPVEEEVLKMAPDIAAKYGIPMQAPPAIAGYINEGDKILLGEEELEIVHTPGHSKGSLTFLHKKDQWMIAGDVLFFESIGRSDLPGGNSQELEDTIRHKLYPLGDAYSVYPGHGPATSIGYEKENNPFVRP